MSDDCRATCKADLGSTQAPERSEFGIALSMVSNGQRVRTVATVRVDLECAHNGQQGCDIPAGRKRCRAQFSRY